MRTTMPTMPSFPTTAAGFCFTCNQDLVGVVQDFACIIRKAAPKIFLFHNVSKDTLNPELCLSPEYPRRFVLLRTPERPPRSKQTLPGMEPGVGGVSWRLRDPTQPYSKQWLTPHLTYYTPPTLSHHFSTHLPDTSEWVMSKLPNKLTDASLIDISDVLPIVPIIILIFRSVSPFLISKS